jgi:hypothetical protein
MASLLGVTVQGDVGTISDESCLAQVQLMSPLDLYRLWERQNEHRHVAYGTRYLQAKARDPELTKRVQAKLVQPLPAAAGVIVPVGVPSDAEDESLGATPAERSQFADRALSRRLKAIGVGLPAISA